MGGPCEIQLYQAQYHDAKCIADAAIAEVQRIEQHWSRYRDDSIISRINDAAGQSAVEVDEETAGLLDYADTAYQQSGGLFDITSGVLRRCWDFKSGEIPTSTAMADILPLVGWQHVSWERPFIRLNQVGMQIDFGGFGKEYAADSAARICRDLGAVHGLVELGGDIHVLGPHPDGSPWIIGIRDPRQPEKAITHIALSEGGMASSGDYERFMLVDGKRYCHILNPETGWPVQDSLAGVSVCAPLCLLAGTGATIAMLRGEHAAKNWLDELGLPWLTVTATCGLEGPLRPY